MSERGVVNLPVRMERADLENLPQWPLPAGFRVRWYRTGDAAAWVRIQKSADRYNHITPLLYHREFGDDETLLHRRQCFLCTEEGREIGTASAWFDERDGTNWGRLHWVAIAPEFQGCGLAKPLMTLVCNRLRELGHCETYLTTSTARVAAIQLYLKFGFKAACHDDADYAVWAAFRSGSIPSFDD